MTAPRADGGLGGDSDLPPHLAGRRERTRPIAATDVIAYPLAAADVALPARVVVEVGGRDRVSRRDRMREHAALRGLRCVFIGVPARTPWRWGRSGRWLGLVTQVYAPRS